MSSNKGTQAKRKYSRISLKKRETLVELVQNDDFTIARAARRLQIRASTARMILNKYRKTGTYPIKNFKKPIKATRRRFPKEEIEVKSEQSIVSVEEAPEVRGTEASPREQMLPEVKVEGEEPRVWPQQPFPFYIYPLYPYFG